MAEEDGGELRMDDGIDVRSIRVRCVRCDAPMVTSRTTLAPGAGWATRTFTCTRCRERTRLLVRYHRRPRH